MNIYELAAIVAVLGIAIFFWVRGIKSWVEWIAFWMAIGILGGFVLAVWRGGL